LSKPANTLRIAVLGDSYTEAFQVDMKKAFWAVMERSLKQCDALNGRTVEVINFGVSGHGTAQEWVRLREDAWKYDPDIVLLAFLTGNDIQNNSYALEKDPLRPYYILKDGGLVLVPPASLSPYAEKARTLWRWLVTHSRMAQLVNFFRIHGAAIGFVAKAKTQLRVGEEGLDEDVYSLPKSPVWRDAWAVTEAVIRGMNREITARGKQFFIATLSNGIQVHPDTSVREAYAKRTGVSDLYYPDNRIINLAKQEGIASVMLAPRLLDWAAKNNTCVHGFENATLCAGHWNEHGHRLAGDILAGEICAQNLGRL
jgi:hypothetical protein